MKPKIDLWPPPTYTYAPVHIHNLKCQNAAENSALIKGVLKASGGRAVVVHAFNASTREAEAGESL